MFYFSDSEIDFFINEDLPFFDVTTGLAGIGDRKITLSFVSREDGVISGSEEAVKIFNKLDKNIAHIKSSSESVKAGEVILEVGGNAKSLLAGWKSAQNIIEYSSGVATLTKKIVQKAKSVNSDIEIVATRKTMPGAKKLLIKAIVAGGAMPHRLGLSETVLFFDQHINLMGGLDSFKSRFAEIKSKSKEKKVMVEVTNLQTALYMASIGVDVIQIDKAKPEDATAIIGQIRKLNKNIAISLAGGINLENITEYAGCGADILVTSALYHAKPLDVTTKISPME